VYGDSCKRSVVFERFILCLKHIDIHKMEKTQNTGTTLTEQYTNPTERGKVDTPNSNTYDHIYIPTYIPGLVHALQ